MRRRAMSRKTELNEFLFYELAFDVVESKDKIQEEWPFDLLLLETLMIGNDSYKIYGFIDLDKEFYLIDGPRLTFFEKNGLSIGELTFNIIGVRWLSERDSIELNKTIIGDINVPSVKERKELIVDLIRTYSNIENPKILEGYYLKRTKESIAVFEDLESSQIFIIGDQFKEIKQIKPDIKTWRGLTIEIGRRIMKTKDLL
jgi:hypothetical protein